MRNSLVGKRKDGNADQQQEEQLDYCVSQERQKRLHVDRDPTYVPRTLQIGALKETLATKKLVLDCARAKKQCML